MSILFPWRALIGSKAFQNSLFLPNMSFKISNIAVKCFRSLFYCITQKSYDVYTIKFLIIYNVMSAFYFLLHKELYALLV